MAKYNIMLSLGLAALAISGPAAASGSGGFGGGFGGSGISGPDTPRDPYADAYARGKSHFKKRIACKQCAYPDGVNDSVTAAKVAKRIRAGEFGLTDAQRNDLLVFLQRRYEIRA